MLTLSDASPVKIVVAAFWNDATAWERAVCHLQSLWGAVEEEYAAERFELSDYYEPEMGPHIQRQLLAFEKLVNPSHLPLLKLATNQIEEELCAGDKNRTVNLDVGYLDLHKLVLASTKEGPHKVFLGKGIWADFTLIFQKGGFHPFPWTFPDFRDGRYHSFLKKVRVRYLEQLRELSAG